MGLIYKITNSINGKIYIGQTCRDLRTRQLEHLRDYKNASNHIPLYNAFKEYGTNNFAWEVIEDNIPNSELSFKEKEYIQKYHSLSHENGYNVTLGGEGGRTSSKLTEADVSKIIEILQDENNLQSFKEIGKLFNVTSCTIRAINIGSAWKNSDITYPIRRYETTGLTLTKIVYHNIVQDLANTSISFTNLAQKYALSLDQLTSINQGKYCYDGTHTYYKNIYDGPFPIRKDNRTFSSADIFVPIFYEVLFTNKSMAAIGADYGIKGNTIQCIISGTRRKELTKNYLLPMRKNIQYNQEIFLKLHPEFQEDK